MIVWTLIHTQFYNYLQIRLLQKSMWHHPDGKQKYGTAGNASRRNRGDAYRKAKVRNSGTQGSPLTWARLADISGENPDPLYKARSGFSILTEECLTFRTTSPLRRVLADAHQENTIIRFVTDHACHRHTRHLRRAMMLSPRTDLRRIWSRTS